MSRVLLHLLLSFALLLNGIGGAQASMRMQVTHDAPSKATHVMDTVAKHGDSPCHEGERPIAPGKDNGCCESGACACGCIGHFQLVLDAPVVLTPCIAHAGSASTMSLGRPAPALPHLIRPPIG